MSSGSHNTISDAVDVIARCVGNPGPLAPDDVRQLLVEREAIWSDDGQAWRMASSLVTEAKRRKIAADEAASRNGSANRELRLAALRAADAYVVAIRLYDALRRAALTGRANGLNSHR